MNATRLENGESAPRNCFSEREDSVFEVFVDQYQPYIGVSVIMVIFKIRKGQQIDTKKPNSQGKIKKQTIITALSFLRSMSNSFHAHLAVFFDVSNLHTATEHCACKSLREQRSGYYQLMVSGDKKLPGFPINRS